jgi:hypothetical protein
LDVDSYFTYPRSRRPAWLGDLREEVTDLRDESPIYADRKIKCPYSIVSGTVHSI